MKRITLFISLLLCLLLTSATAQTFDYSKLEPHPRLLLKKGGEAAIKESLQKNPELMKIHRQILSYCEDIMVVPNETRVMEGKRLLAVSRNVLKKVFYLSYAYRMTGDVKYANRAEQEMLAACSFTDWNPSHYLDVAEMTFGLSIGYDWLFDVLKDSSKATIRKAIQEKAFESSKDKKKAWFYTAYNNWNQVCNGGLVYGALATFEDNREASTAIIEKAMEAIKLPLAEYNPDGAYSEGYGYWGYGTTFQVLLIEAIETALNTTFDLSGFQGFLKTPKYLQFMTAPSGQCFNYSDAGKSVICNLAMFWFARRTGDSSLLWVERNCLRQEKPQVAEDRLLPALVLFGSAFDLNKIEQPSTNFWLGKGKTPVILARTGWAKKEDAYLGMKGGSPSTSHAHMDAGSFVFETSGVRWAMDLGMQSYYSLEKEKVDLWNMSQEGGRWDVFRLNNYVHNTLTVNDKKHNVNSHADIVKTYNTPNRMGGRIEMTDVFGGDLKAAQRDIVLKDKKYLEVTDYIKTSDIPAKLMWVMCTPAAAKVVDDKTIELEKDGKLLHLTVKAPVAVNLKIWSNTPVHSYDQPNPGSQRVGFELSLPARKNARIEVTLMPVEK